MKKNRNVSTYRLWRIRRVVWIHFASSTEDESSVSQGAPQMKSRNEDENTQEFGNTKHANTQNGYSITLRYSMY